MFFKCNVPSPNNPNNFVIKELAFIEELWPFQQPLRDSVIVTEFGCKRLYRTSPVPTYYVIDVWRIIGARGPARTQCAARERACMMCRESCGVYAGPAPIIRDPASPTIPFGSIPRRSSANPSAKADSRKGAGDGSGLFLMNKWQLQRRHC